MSKGFGALHQFRFGGASRPEMTSGEWVDLKSFDSVTGSGYTWQTAMFAGLSDDTYAFAFSTDTNPSNILEALRLAKIVPAGSTIDGIQVRMEKHVSAADAVDTTVQLYKAGTLQGDNNADTVTTWPTVDPDSYVTYGGVADLWGLTWTVDQINASDFGVGFAGESTVIFLGLNVDHIQIAVTFS